MTFKLDADQLAWLDARIGSGEFASVDEAMRQLVSERIAERQAEEEDDLAWAKPYVDATEVDIDSGRFFTFAEHRVRMDALIQTLKG